MRRLATLALLCLARASVAEEPEASPLEAQIAQLRSRYLQERETAAEEIIKFGDKVTPRVAELLQDADQRVQRSAVEILSRIGTVTSIQPLLPLITHPDPTIRDQVRESFVKLGREVRPALEAARDADAKVAPDIQELLKEMSQSEIEEAFQGEVMPDGSSGFFNGQFGKLKSLGPDVGPMLAAMVSDGFEFKNDTTGRGRFRIMAIDAMADIGYAEGVTDLMRLAEGTGDVARAAAGALWRLGQKEPAQRIEAELAETVKQGPVQTRMMTQQYLAEIYSRTDQYEKAVEMYQAAIATTGGMQGTVQYNLACAYSRMGKKKEAVDALKKAVDGGFRNGPWMKKDGDLDAIRGEAGYKDLERKLSGEEVEERPPQQPEPPSGGGGRSE